jgi:hypothetical protein
MWKMMNTLHIENDKTFLPETVLDTEIDAGSVWTVDWIRVESVILLREDGIVAVVNHGSSSSWHDATG